MISKNKKESCPACEGIGEILVIKNVAKIGRYHLGKECKEKCNFCSMKNKELKDNSDSERTLH